MRRVPPIHLHVEFAVPGVDSEAGLLRWERAGIVYGHDVLRENDAPLQLGGARVGVSGEVDRTAGGPVVLPVRARSSLYRRNRIGIGRDGLGREPRGQLNAIRSEERRVGK